MRNTRSLWTAALIGAVAAVTAQTQRHKLQRRIISLTPAVLVVGAFMFSPRVGAQEFQQTPIYLIRNSRLDPGWAEVERRTLTIAGRAIASLILTQGIGDLYRIYSTSQRDGVDYNLAFIPETFNAPHKEEFDTEYMRQLFKVGYDRAVKGYTWLKKPPGF